MIPELLQKQKKWVCWKLEDRNGRITKVPYNPRTGEKAKSTDPDTWSSYEEVCQAKGYHGIGYVFNGDGIFGIDIDHCIDENNKITKEVKDLIIHLGSYTEKSPSGQGIHILGLYKGTDMQGKRKGSYEMYFTGRYFTMTGRALQFSDELRDLTPEVEYLKEHYFNQKEEGKEEKRKTIFAPMQDKELLEKIFHWRNGDLLKAIYEGENPKFDGDRSANDFFFIKAVNFANGNNLAQTDRIFRGSGRMRAKWDEKHYSNGDTYGQRLLKDTRS